MPRTSSWIGAPIVAAFATMLAGCPLRQDPPPRYYPPPQQPSPQPNWGNYQPPPPQPTWPPAQWWNPNLPQAPNPFDNGQRCTDAINRHRVSLGLPTLSRWMFAEMCASGQAQSGAQTGQPHGAFGHCGEFAQNVCPNWAGPPDRMIGACIESEWQEGPGFDYYAHGHYLNMTNPRYTKVACGFYTAPNGQVWAVQDFQ
jgi:hypothetical protein